MTQKENVTVEVGESQALVKTGGNIEYADAMGETVALDIPTVKAYLVSGKPELVSNEEVVLFIKRCQFERLNPWRKECYLIKYSSYDPAAFVVAAQTHAARATNNPRFSGISSGLIIKGEDGKKPEYIGESWPDMKDIIGAWAEVYMEGYSKPVRREVAWEEYAGYKGDGTLNKNWEKRGRTMILKVARTQARREACPKETGGLYVEEEFGYAGEGIARNVTPSPKDKVAKITMGTAEEPEDTVLEPEPEKPRRGRKPKPEPEPESDPPHKEEAPTSVPQEAPPSLTPDEVLPPDDKTAIIAEIIEADEQTRGLQHPSGQNYGWIMKNAGKSHGKIYETIEDVPIASLEAALAYYQKLLAEKKAGVTHIHGK